MFNTIYLDKELEHGGFSAELVYGDYQNEDIQIYFGVDAGRVVATAFVKSLALYLVGGQEFKKALKKLFDRKKALRNYIVRRAFACLDIDEMIQWIEDEKNKSFDNGKRAKQQELREVLGIREY